MLSLDRQQLFKARSGGHHKQEDLGGTPGSAGSHIAALGVVVQAELLVVTRLHYYSRI